MKKFVLILTVLSMMFAVTGCNDVKKDLYLPEAKNDKIYTAIGGNDEKDPSQQSETGLHEGDGYTLSVPTQGYRYEKDFDDGALEEKWDYITKDDVDLKVTTYKDSDEVTARSRFLRDNDDYIFEDLMGYSLCGMEIDGDTLWFNLHESDGNIYIVSWEYPKNTDEYIKAELAAIAESFVINNAE